MITIIPNWHPLFVHFTIGLLASSVIFYFARLLVSDKCSWKEQWTVVGNWCLWSGCLFSLATLVAGWFAYNTVSHDAVSHAAMTLHRNWAIPTIILFLVLAYMAIRQTQKSKTTSISFLSLCFVGLMSLMITGWLGAEGVYRYGLGVISLPEQQENGHDHSQHDHSDEQVVLPENESATLIDGHNSLEIDAEAESTEHSGHHGDHGHH